jgi:hypothetical protein
MNEREIVAEERGKIRKIKDGSELAASQRLSRHL